jgi:4-hydroxybutyryl-CoA dehydratase / vinylacetyl-CoA-Delta-isomerase
MALMTAQQYKDSLKDGRVVYLCGERVPDVLADPTLKTCIETAAIDYEMTEMEEYRDLAVVTREDGDPISRYYHVPRSGDDLLKRHELMVEATRLGSGAIPFTHDIASDAMNAVNITATLMGKEEYRERAEAYRRYLQDRDLSVAVAMSDVKGDRSQRPSSPKQGHPDYYLRVVDKGDDGIVVRGAKAHISAAAYFNELFVVPCRNMSEADADYALSFAIPVDTPGIIQVAHPIKADFSPLDFPVDIPLRWHTDSLVIFDDVFVPWERVFLCGESAFAMPLVYNFAYFHRHTAASYRIPVSEMMVGMAQAMAEYNGVDKATHIIEKITDLVIYVNMLKSLSRAACVDFVVHGGIPTPNPVITNMAKYYFASNFHRCVEIVQDVSGGLLSTAPTYADFANPEIGGFIDKYLGGAGEATAEQRLRMLQFIRRILCQEIEVLAVQGEGSFQAQRMTIYLESQDEIEQYKKMTEREAGITSS